MTQNGRYIRILHHVKNLTRRISESKPSDMLHNTVMFWIIRLRTPPLDNAEADINRRDAALIAVEPAQHQFGRLLADLVAGNL